MFDETRMELAFIRGRVAGIVSGYKKGYCSANDAFELIEKALAESESKAKHHHDKCIVELIG